MMLSVVIIAKDAALTLPNCLKSIKRLACEVIVVVDSRSRDETVEIAKATGARVFKRKFDNFAAQKNFGLTKAGGEWVLALDADEEISVQLAEEIARVLPLTSATAFKIARLNYIWGKAMSHTDWDPQTDTHVWLWKRGSGQWVGNVHEEVVVLGKIDHLQGYKIHHNYQSVEQFLDKMNQYTTLEAQNRTFSLPLLFIYPVWKFIRHYIIYQGFLDGWHGLALSYLMAIYGLAIYIKAWEKKSLSSLSF